MTLTEANIRERFNKVQILVPESVIPIYQSQRDDIRALLGIIDMQNAQIAQLMNRDSAA
jgi:hypothetical protein